MCLQPLNVGLNVVIIAVVLGVIINPIYVICVDSILVVEFNVVLKS